jgi:hypothetical protein
LVNQRDRNDRRHLLQQTQRIDPASVIFALGPWKLHDPAELIAYSIDESLYPVGCRPGLHLKNLIEMKTLVSIAEPGLARSAQHKRHDHCDKQCDEVLEEERATRAGHRKVIP